MFAFHKRVSCTPILQT